MKRQPKYCHYKRKDLAFVWFGKRQVFLGKYQSDESWVRYHRACAEITAGRDPAPRQDRPDPARTVGWLVEEFTRRRVTPYYRSAGKATGEATNFHHALDPLAERFGKLPASSFGPLQLKSYREALILRGQARTTINRNVGRVRQMFRWATGEELYPAEKLAALQAVEGLAKGRSAARETDEVAPADPGEVERTRTELAEKIRNIVDLIALSGARPGEICKLRPCELKGIGDEVWRYEPDQHKTKHKNKDRVIFLGPRAQAILAPLLAGCEPGDHLFAPADTKPGNWRGKPKPGRTKPYNVAVLRNEIAKACDRAGVPRWRPNQLRHAAATEIRRGHGLDGAQAILGHASAKTTERYAEPNRDEARRIMGKIG